MDTEHKQDRIYLSSASCKCLERSCSSKKTSCSWRSDSRISVVPMNAWEFLSRSASSFSFVWLLLGMNMPQYCASEADQFHRRSGKFELTSQKRNIHRSWWWYSIRAIASTLNLCASNIFPYCAAKDWSTKDAKSVGAFAPLPGDFISRASVVLSLWSASRETRISFDACRFRRASPFAFVPFPEPTFLFFVFDCAPLLPEIFG